MDEDKDPAIESKRVKMSDPTEPDVNPLLIDLVLEVIFPYCKDPDENWRSLSDFRTVCQIWNEKLVEQIRQDTQINLVHLISPYPSGLGWTEDEGMDPGFQYKCPFMVTPFENIEVTGSCQFLEDPKVIRWFQVMGGTVKQLRFTSSLTCYHHIRFLECVLTLWCPNLKSLNLNGVACIYTLVHNSKFVDSSSLICDLEEIVISVEGEDEEPKSLFRSCQPDLLEKYLNFGDSTHKLLQDDPALRAFGFKILKRLSRDFQEPIPQNSLDFIRNTTGSDGGVLGRICRSSGIEKLVVKQLNTHQCQDLLTFLNFRPIKMRDTLKHFEFHEFPLGINTVHMSAFRILNFPLKTIRFGTLFALQIRSSLRDLLASYSETLEHLEFTGNVVLQNWAEEQDEEYIELLVPRLPKLKTFINQNIFTCRMGGLDFLSRLPNLEKCTLSNPIYHSSIYPLTPAEVFNLLFQSSNFEESHKLKELVLDGKICYSSHLEMLQMWFPAMVKIDVILDGADVFVDFLRIAKNMNFEDVKISFHANDNEWCNAGIVNSIPKMSSLKYLQLTHLPDSPLTLSVRTCEDGFARAPKLTSLKLTNFGIFADELEQIRTCLSHISCVKFSKTIVQYKAIDMDFSVGVHKSFPFPV